MTAPPIEQTAAADLQHQLGQTQADNSALRWRIEAAIARLNQGDVFDDPGRIVLMLVEIREILTGRTDTARANT